MDVKEIRSVRHLAREVGNSLRTVLINFRENGWCFCKAILVNKSNALPVNALFIFNRQYNIGMFRMNNVLCLNEFNNTRVELSSSFNKLMSISEEEYGVSDLDRIISSIILLPESFDNDYNDFVKENTKVINTLIHKYGFSMLDDYIKMIYMYTGGSKNFFVWAVNTYFQNHTSLNAIKRIMYWNDNYGQLTKKLLKSTITAYTSKTDIYALFDEMVNLRREKRINDVINMFNTAQKKILKNAELSLEDKKVISSFYRLSESKKINFIKKVSTIEDFNEIMRQMRHVTSTHYSWNKESFIDYIMNVENLNYEKVYENGNIILIKVNDFETIKHLAKTTNWCISKNKSYWNSYVERVPDATQYMLFDFGKKEDNVLSIVGFTTRYNRGITNAHNFVNTNMLSDNVISDNSFINSYISKFKSTNGGIYNFLGSCGIDLNLVAKYDKPLFEWNRESMFKYLYECVNKGNVDVLVDKNNMVALSVRDKNIRYFLGDTYIDNIGSEYWGWQHIIFMDFSMNQYDPNRLQYALIKNNPCGEEDYCTNMFNEHHMDCNVSFDSKLAQYGLPYTTIRRVNDEYVRLRDALQSYNIPIIVKGINNKKLFEEVVNDYIGQEAMIDMIENSIVEYMSFDYLDVFYANGHTMNEFFSDMLIGNLLNRCMSSLISRSISMNNYSKCPSSEDIAAFFDKNVDTLNKTFYIGIFLAIDKVLANEIIPGHRADVMFKRVLRNICSHVNSKHNEGIYDYFVNKIMPFITKDASSEFFGCLKTYHDNVAGKETKALIEHYSENLPRLKAILGDNKAEYEKVLGEDEATPEWIDDFEEDVDVPQDQAGWNVPANEFAEEEPVLVGA